MLIMSYSYHLNLRWKSQAVSRHMDIFLCVSLLESIQIAMDECLVQKQGRMTWCPRRTPEPVMDCGWWKIPQLSLPSVGEF